MTNVNYLVSISSSYFDLSRSANLHNSTEQPGCFYIPAASAEPLTFEGRVVGDILQGNNVNCELVSLCPHGSCTHTECIGHITPEKSCVIPPPPLMNSVLVSVNCTKDGDEYFGKSSEDRMITRANLENAVQVILGVKGRIEAVIIRTEIGSATKNINFSGTNPPFISPAAMNYLVSIGCRHLLLDLPSVDKEDDGGYLASHSVFFGLPPRMKEESTGKVISRSVKDVNSQRIGCTITELCYISKDIPDGKYILSLQVSPLLLDAIPSRPIIFSEQ